METACPNCKHRDLEAEVRQRVVLALRCTHCGWSLPSKRVAEINSLDLQDSQEFLFQLGEIIHRKEEVLCP